MPIMLRCRVRTRICQRSGKSKKHIGDALPVNRSRLGDWLLAYGLPAKNIRINQAVPMKYSTTPNQSVFASLAR